VFWVKKEESKKWGKRLRREGLILSLKTLHQAEGKVRLHQTDGVLRLRLRADYQPSSEFSVPRDKNMAERGELASHSPSK